MSVQFLCTDVIDGGTGRINGDILEATLTSVLEEYLKDLSPETYRKKRTYIVVSNSLTES